MSRQRRLMSATVDVHVVRLREDGWRRHDIVLSAAERTRQERLLREEDQEAFTICRAMLRRLLAARLAVAPLSLSFIDGRYGKPHLTDRALCFNVSHSADWALIAISSHDAVGVDIERQRPLEDMMALAQRSFSAAEQDALWRLPMHLRSEGFFRCWTRKEAFIKAIGMGLSFPLDRFDVTLDPRIPARILDIRSPRHATSDWTLHHLEAVPRYSAALVTRGPAQVRLISGATPDIV